MHSGNTKSFFGENKKIGQNKPARPGGFKNNSFKKVRGWEVGGKLSKPDYVTNGAPGPLILNTTTKKG